MAVKVPQGWYDISVPLKQGMPYFPTDPVPPRIYRMTDRNLGGVVTMSMLEIISHTGTHIDSPLHFIDGGSTISDMPLDATIGPCKVIESKDTDKIGAGERSLSTRIIELMELRRHLTVPGLIEIAEIALREAFNPQGMNMGLNLGKAAGAGILEHLHFNVVPRWVGDTNFMTVVGQTRVLPQELPVTADRLRPIFERLSNGA